MDETLSGEDRITRRIVMKSCSTSAQDCPELGWFVLSPKSAGVRGNLDVLSRSCWPSACLAGAEHGTVGLCCPGHVQKYQRWDPRVPLQQLPKAPCVSLLFALGSVPRPRYPQVPAVLSLRCRACSRCSVQAAQSVCMHVYPVPGSPSKHFGASMEKFSS